MQFPDSELILNPDGSVYHLHLRPEHISDLILTVGDPERVEKVSKYFDSVEFKTQKREFVSHTGYVGKRRLSVVSSGIGTDNVEILMNELDALVNIDLERREEKSQHTTLKIIRMGTSGSLREEIPVDSLLLSASGVGLDSLMQFYELPQSEEEIQLGLAVKEALLLDFQTYKADCSPSLQSIFGNHFIIGNTVTCPGFYAPQGRKLRYTTKVGDLPSVLRSFEKDGYQFSNFEMETAGYYAFGRLLGHEMLSLNAIVANRAIHQFSKDPEKQVNNLIELVLSKVEGL